MLSEVNEALAAIAKVNADLGVDAARSQFETAEAAVQQRYLQVNALTELSEPAAITTELDQLTLDNKITERLQRLETGAKL